MKHFQDTIAAIATPLGLGGIAVLRISGPDARRILQRLFVSRQSPESSPASRSPFSFQPRYMHYGSALDAEGAILDAVLAVFMPGPHSATGEDVGEIHCHGGTGVTSALLEAAMAAGARLAEPGEFTRRAFLNGRMDLAQAEAVAELISARSREGVRLASAKLDGVLSQEVNAVREKLDAMRMQITLAVDFSDEDAELLSQAGFSASLLDALAAIDRLLAGFRRARLWREGALAVLAGRVNVGKSSLLNALLGRERAIVSDTPGTTRDYIEESIVIKGMPLRLMDTAGLRQGGDVVEEEGIRRSRGLADEADVILFVLDARENLHPEETDFLQKHARRLQDGTLLLVLNKVDTVTERPSAMPDELLGMLTTGPCYAVSAKHGQGLDALSEGIRMALLRLSDSGDSSGDIAPNLRQSLLLERAGTELRALKDALESGYPADILSVHLESAAEFLNAVTGYSSTEDLLDSIFASFCIGK